MATKFILLEGEIFWAKVWPNQIDRDFAEDDSIKGGNWSIDFKFTEDALKTFKALGLKNRAIDKEGSPANGGYRLRRYEFKSDGKGGVVELGAPNVILPEGVEAGQFIGNGSKGTVQLEVYDFEYKKKPGRASRLAGLTVTDFVPYVKATATEEAKAAVPAVPF